MINTQTLTLNITIYEEVVHNYGGTYEGLVNPLKENDPRILDLVNESLRSHGILNIATWCSLTATSILEEGFPLKTLGLYWFNIQLSFGTYNLKLIVSDKTRKQKKNPSRKEIMESKLNNTKPITEEGDTDNIYEKDSIVSCPLEVCTEAGQLKYPLHLDNEELKYKIFDVLSWKDGFSAEDYILTEYDNGFNSVFPLLYTGTNLLIVKTKSGTYPIKLQIVKSNNVFDPESEKVEKVEVAKTKARLETEHDWLKTRVDVICKAVTETRENKLDVPGNWYVEMERHLKIVNNGVQQLGDSFFKKVNIE